MLNSIVHTDPAPTLDDVWRLFREMALETKQRSQDFDRELKELKQLCKEQNEAAEKRSQEINRQFQETDKKLKRYLSK